ncbi:MAG: M23 family metallopeptidase [Verrucomicrobia bacterium]|nr:M23 family metallopeptidase [Verrucomicrobiota bacterium]
MLRPSLTLLVAAACLTARSAEPLFQLPTANRAIFEAGGEARFFAPTVGKTWVAGTFGCVRTEGRQLHEGVDILHQKTDRRGEPIDPVMAVANGTVVYVNTHSGLSNYGNYIVIRHAVDGLTLCSLYAHRLAFQKPRRGEKRPWQLEWAQSSGAGSLEPLFGTTPRRRQVQPGAVGERPGRAVPRVREGDGLSVAPRQSGPHSAEPSSAEGGRGGIRAGVELHGPPV